MLHLLHFSSDCSQSEKNAKKTKKKNKTKKTKQKRKKKKTKNKERLRFSLESAIDRKRYNLHWNLNVGVITAIYQNLEYVENGWSWSETDKSLGLPILMGVLNIVLRCRLLWVNTESCKLLLINNVLYLVSSHCAPGWNTFCVIGLPSINILK